MASRYEELRLIKEAKLKSRKHLTLPVVKFNKKRKSYYSEDCSEEDDDAFDEDSEKTDEDNPAESDETIKEIKRNFRVPRNVWIIKPGENTNRGNGINVSSDIAEIKSLV